jgi:hypothetical protein
MKKIKESATTLPVASVMRVLDKTPKLSRRSFLRGGGIAAIGVTVVPATALMLSPDEAWAQAFTTLGQEAGKILPVMARDIFPHDRLAEKYYQQAVASYDAAAAKDEKLKKLMVDGIAKLNATSKKMFGKSYTEVRLETDRVAVLKEIEASDFFQKIKGDLVTGLYNNKAIWPLFGYEGSSWEKGGYLNRGFNDIDWI